MKKDGKKLLFAALTSILCFSLYATEARGAFKLNDKKGEYLDILLNGKIISRYMYAYDNSSKDRLNETYKPYLHVFDPDGTAPITKGAGGQYTHHRGIFIGWKQVEHKGEKYDRWHMKGGEQIHRKFLKTGSSPKKAVITSFVDWNDNENSPILKEERTMTFLPAPSGAYLMIDFITVLKANAGDLNLGGDPEHSGIQFRPADEVKREKTLYVFPEENANPKKDVDYDWVGETFLLGEKQYSVVIMNHPDNPKQTKFSAYRDYGRFGAFPTASITAKGSLTLKYRFLIAQGEMLKTAAIQACCNKFTGLKKPVPKTTVTKAATKKKRQKKKNRKKK